MSPAIANLFLTLPLNFAPLRPVQFCTCLVLFSQHPACSPEIHIHYLTTLPGSVLCFSPTCSFIWSSPNISVFINFKTALIKTDGQIIISRTCWNAHKLLPTKFVVLFVRKHYYPISNIYTHASTLGDYILPLNRDGEISLIWNVKIWIIRGKYLLHRTNQKLSHKICAVHLRSLTNQSRSQRWTQTESTSLNLKTEKKQSSICNAWCYHPFSGFTILTVFFRHLYSCFILVSAGKDFFLFSCFVILKQIYRFIFSCLKSLVPNSKRQKLFPLTVGCSLDGWLGLQ